MERTKLYGGTNRDEAHRVLEYVLNQHISFDRPDKGKDKDFPGCERFADVTAPQACCIEDPNHPTEPFQVWDSPPEAHKKEEQGGVVRIGLSDEEEDRIVTRLADKLLKKMAVSAGAP